jgi:hypothetical protein
MIEQIENRKIINKVWDFIYNYSDSYSFMNKSFESSCKILHTFGYINNGDIHEIKDKAPDLIKELDWKVFCEKFDLDITIDRDIIIGKIHTLFIEKYGDKDFKNFYWPTGSLGKRQITEILIKMNDTYSFSQIYIFYSEIVNLIFDLNKDELYTGQIQDIASLIHSKKDFSPTVWWDNDLRWMIYTDYDLCFSNVFGEKEFIDKLVQSNNIESFII